MAAAAAEAVVDAEVAAAAPVADAADVALVLSDARHAQSQVAVHRGAAAGGARLRYLLSVYRQAAICWPGSLSTRPISCFHCNVRRATMGGLPVAGECVPTQSKNASARTGHGSPAGRAIRHVSTI